MSRTLSWRVVASALSILGGENACCYSDEILNLCVVRGIYINVHGFEVVNSTGVKG